MHPGHFNLKGPLRLTFEAQSHSDTAKCKSPERRGFTIIELLIVSMIITISALPSQAQTNCAPAPSGLVSWWRGENDASDAIATNDGALAGEIGFGPGEVGNSFVFNGTNASVRVPASSSLNVGQDQGFSLECWINPAQIADAQPLVEWFTGIGPPWGVHFWISEAGSGTGPGCLYVNIPDTFGGEHKFSSAAGIVGTNFWQHVAVTYDQATGNTKLFYNGAVVAEQTLGSYTPQTSYPLYLGRRPPGSNKEVLFSGGMDEVSLYSRALSINEIQGIYNAGTAGKCVISNAPPVAPIILSQPTNIMTYVGSNVTLSVTAGGDAPLLYQWRLNGDDLPGKTSRVLALPNVQLSNAGPYSVIVSNIIGWIVSSNAVLTVKPLPECVPPPSGLVSWWRAETNSLDNWDSNDASTTRSFAPGKVGLAFYNVSLSVPDSASLHFSNAITIEAWVNPSSSGGLESRTIVSKFDSASRVQNGTNSSFYFGLTNNGRPIFILSPNGSPRTNVTLIVNQPLPNNRWTFLVGTYDGSAVSFYVDGVLAAQTNYDRGIFAGTSTLSIGAVPVPPVFFTQYFPGLIDEVSLYNRALTDREVQTLFSADFVGKCLVRPSIVTQPRDQAVPLGEDVRFAASVFGSRPLKYQWRFNGVNIANATNSALVLEKLQPNRVGNYSVSVSNAVGTVTSSNAALTLLAPPICTDIPAGLISWWPADRNSSDAMGTNDIREGAFYETGKVSQAFNFRSGFPARLQVFSSTLNFGSNADFSIEMWIKIGGTNPIYPNVPILEKRDPGNFWLGYSLSLNQGRLAFAMGSSPVSATNVSTFISSGPDLRDEMFHHVAVSVNRTTTNGGNLYVDGQLVMNFDPTARKGSLASNNSLLIGSPANTISNAFFVGLIDEPAIYNRALSAKEILAIRQAGAAGKCKVKPSLVVQPVSQRVTSGSNATFSVVAVGTPLLRYQWLRGGQPLDGATSSVYTLVAKSSVTLSVRVTNLFGSITSSNVVLTINLAPTVLPQIISLNEDTPTSITLAGTDPDGDALSYPIVTPPGHGSLSGTGSILIYTPVPNYFGPDSFTFQAHDGISGSAPATVNLSIMPVNDRPVAQSQNVTLDEDTTATFTLGGVDADGDPLTFAIGVPAHGTLTGTPPNLTYRPDTNYFGPDSFTFSVNDGQTNSEVATVSLTVRPVNDPPVAKITVSPLIELPGITNRVVISAVCGNGTVVLDGSESSDVEHDQLTYFWMEGTNVFAQGAMVTNEFEPGTHELALEVSDGTANAKETVTVEVAAPSDAIAAIIVSISETGLDGRDSKALLHPLELAGKEMDRCNAAAAMSMVIQFQKKLEIIARINPKLAEQLRVAAQAILDSDGKPLTGKPPAKPR